MRLFSPISMKPTIITQWKFFGTFVLLAGLLGIECGALAAKVNSCGDGITTEISKNLKITRPHFAGFVELENFGKVYVDILKGSPKKESVLFLGGITYDSSRSEEFAQALHAQGYTVIRPELLGQGRTLLEKIESERPDGGATVAYQTQLKLIHELQEKLGIKKVTIAGMSYGGGLAGAYAQRFPEKVTKALLIAPYVISMEKSVPGASMFSGFMRMNPFGSALLDMQTKSFLKMTFSKSPPYLNPYPNQFNDALFGLTTGIDALDLRDTASHIRVPVHLLRVAQDVLVPSQQLDQLWQRLPPSFRGSSTTLAGEHDIVGTQPDKAAEWAAHILAQ